MFPLALPRTHYVCVCDLTQFGCEDINQYSTFSFVCVCVCVCVCVIEHHISEYTMK